MRPPVLLGVTAVVLAIDVHVAGAQTTQWKEKVRLSGDVGVQLSSTTFTTTTAPTVFLEPSTITTSYTVPRGKLFDGGILYRLAGSFGVGVALSSFSERNDAPVTGSIPNPFGPLGSSTPAYPTRALNGTANGLQRSELAAHIQAAYVITMKRYDIAISGGPTIFRVSQDLVSDAVYAETYPYDTVAFTSATTVETERTKVGFNVGVDVGYRLSRKLGVGGLARFSRATLSLPLTGSAANVEVDAGGLQVAGGVRFFF
jgi:hypothetical protein